jgi:ethanolamine utilization protein EutN
MPRAALVEGSPRRGEEVIAYDDLGASPGAHIGLSEGREAANPFGKDKTPVDAYCACLLDRIDLDRGD